MQHVPNTILCPSSRTRALAEAYSMAFLEYHYPAYFQLPFLPYLGAESADLPHSVELLRWESPSTSRPLHCRTLSMGWPGAGNVLLLWSLEHLCV